LVERVVTVMWLDWGVGFFTTRKDRGKRMAELFGQRAELLAIKKGEVVR